MRSHCLCHPLNCHEQLAYCKCSAALLILSAFEKSLELYKWHHIGHGGRVSKAWESQHIGVPHDMKAESAELKYGISHMYIKNNVKKSKKNYMFIYVYVCLYYIIYI